MHLCSWLILCFDVITSLLDNIVFEKRNKVSPPFPALSLSLLDFPLFNPNSPSLNKMKLVKNVVSNSVLTVFFWNIFINYLNFRS